MAKDPVFIVYEGIDGSGKSAQVIKMAEHLTKLGREVKLAADPGGTSLGEMLRSMVKNKHLAMNIQAETLLFTAARAQLADMIREHLAKGTDVISDRWWWSTLLYQSRKDQSVRPKIRKLHEDFVGLEPTLYVHLAIDAKEAQQRLAAAPHRRKHDIAAADDRFESEGLALAEYLAKGYAELAHDTNLNLAGGPGPGVVTVDASRQQDQVFDETLLRCRAHEFFLEIESKT